MPTSTVNWLWIGNIPLIDSTPTSNVTQAQLNSAGITGYTAFGPGQIAPVALTGSTTGSGGQQVFTAPFNRPNNFTSQFSFDSPTTTGVVPGVSINTTFRAEVAITLPDNTTVTQVATIVQMANGDVFLRPNAQFVAQWAGIDSLRSITLTQATPFAQNTVLNSTISFSPGIFDIDVPCFGAGTMIATPDGPRLIETLKVGDLVLTADHGPQAIRWIKARRVHRWALAAAERLRPVRIRAGALGAGCPQRDLLVSQQHRMLVRSRIAERMFEAAEVLVAARHLIGLPGIEIAGDVAEVTYLHFLCDRHEVVYANGAPTESLYAGPVAMKALGEAAAAEILGLFPELGQMGSFGLTPARVLVKGREGRSMAERHSRNAVALLAA